MPRPQRRRKKSRTLGKSLLLLVAINIVPLLILATLAVMYARGEIVILEDRIPAGTTETLMWVGGILVVLFLVASWSLPAAHDGVKAIESWMARGRAILAGKEEGSKFLVVVAWPFQLVMWMVGWIGRFALILLSFTLIAVLFVFLARLKWPELGQEQIDWLLEQGGRFG
ncbi:MAG: hypothetical protein CMJ83_21205 [Planctomycetes bacterium]|nr:hypothetical protein [Planctomycetota bacterium]